jgi:thiol-disulfide isomerase/thioredoxin
MKKILLSSALAIFAGGMLMAQPQHRFEVKGHISNLADGDTVRLVFVSDDKGSKYTLAKGGTFTFTGTQLVDPPIAYIKIGAQWTSNMFLENTVYTVTGDAAQLHGATIVGGLLQKEYQELLAAYATGKTMEFVEAHPNSLVSVNELRNNAPRMALSESWRMFNALTPAVQNSGLGKLFKARMEELKKLEVGQVLPDFIGQTPIGKKVSMKSIAAKSKYTLIDFWASWCGPCRMENPTVLAAYEKYKAKGLDVISFSLDDNATKWKTAIIEDKLPWHQLSDLKGQHGVAKTYQITAIPQMFLVDQDGRLIAKNLRGEKIEEKLSELMGETPTLISGKVNNDRVTTMFLYKVEEGSKVQYASQQLNEAKTFAFAVPDAVPGFYYVGDNRKNQYLRIYLKGKEDIKVSLDEEGYSMTTTSAENKLLNQWQQIAGPVTNKAFEFYKDTLSFYSWFPMFEQLLPKAAAFKNTINGSDKKFNSLLKYTIDHDLEMAALYFLLTPHSVHPTKQDYLSFYHKIIQPAKYKDTRILQFGNGADLINSYTTYCRIYHQNKISPDSLLYWGAGLFGNDTVKGVFITGAMSRFTTYEKLAKAMAPVKSYLVTPVQVAKYRDYEKPLRSFGKGAPAYNFSYPDTEGKKVSLSDLKGKVVVVDIWATWCGPCVKEIPYLKELSEALKGQDVSFVSISVDEPKDLQKWKNYVKKEVLDGVQLNDSAGEILAYYVIPGIPRFMVFDKAGNIISIDAPRPSDPALKLLIEEALKG